MFSVENKRKVKDRRFKLGEAAVGTKHMENIFCGRILCDRLVDKEAATVYIVILCVVAVDSNERQE